MKNNSEEPLKREWTGPIDNGEKFHSALMGWVHTRDYVGGAIRRVNAYVVPTWDVSNVCHSNAYSAGGHLTILELLVQLWNSLS